MFYWSYKDIYVVLSDDEEMALVQELGKDPLERVGYHTSRKLRKDIEQRIFRYFEQSLHADPYVRISIPDMSNRPNNRMGTVEE